MLYPAAGALTKAPMNKHTALTVLISTLLCACSYPEAPPCSFTGEPAVAPSAGCFFVINQRLLVVQGLGGKISPPGGSSNSDETAKWSLRQSRGDSQSIRRGLPPLFFLKFMPIALGNIYR